MLSIILSMQNVSKIYTLRIFNFVDQLSNEINANWYPTKTEKPQYNVSRFTCKVSRFTCIGVKVYMYKVSWSTCKVSKFTCLKCQGLHVKCQGLHV